MRIHAVNIGLSQVISINGCDVISAINKTPINRRVWLGKISLHGDEQADKNVHGGEHQAVYSYPLEHYQYWQTELSNAHLPIGTFGENFTITGLLEHEVQVGDILQIGQPRTGAVVQVTMPRIPCFKFAHKIGKPDILSRFLASGRSGFYQRVLSEGEVGHGDSITMLERAKNSISIREALGLQKLHEGDQAMLQKALRIQSLAPLLHEVFSARLATEF